MSTLSLCSYFLVCLSFKRRSLGEKESIWPEKGKILSLAIGPTFLTYKSKKWDLLLFHRIFVVWKLKILEKVTILTLLTNSLSIKRCLNLLWQLLLTTSYINEFSMRTTDIVLDLVSSKSHLLFTYESIHLLKILNFSLSRKNKLFVLSTRPPSRRKTRQRDEKIGPQPIYYIISPKRSLCIGYPIYPSVRPSVCLYSYPYPYLSLYSSLYNPFNWVHYYLRLFGVLSGRNWTSGCLRSSYRVYLMLPVLVSSIIMLRVWFRFPDSWVPLWPRLGLPMTTFGVLGFSSLRPKDYRFMVSSSNRVEVLSLSIKRKTDGKTRETRELPNLRRTGVTTPTQKEWVRWLGFE